MRPRKGDTAPINRWGEVRHRRYVGHSQGQDKTLVSESHIVVMFLLIRSTQIQHLKGDY